MALAPAAVSAVLLASVEILSGEPAARLPASASAAEPFSPFTTVAARRPSPPFPNPRAVASARRFVRGRKGLVAFAVIDTRGRLRGLHVHRSYRSASVTKAMLLVAYLRRHRQLDPRARGLLGEMVRESDNDAASAIYGQVGDAGLLEVGRRAGMTRLRPAGAWSETWITAADQARFFKRVRRLTPPRHRRYALRLLSSIVPYQRWGVPRAVPKGFHVYFKGGWRPEAAGRLVHQAALVERGKLRVSIAVLTTGDPGHSYGAQTIERIAARLLHGAGRHPLARRRS
jgi:hypothetical protein